MCVNMTTVEITCSRNVFPTVTLPVPISEMYVNTSCYHHSSGFRCRCPVDQSYHCLMCFGSAKIKNYETCEFHPVAYYTPVDDSCKVEIQEYDHILHEFGVELEYDLDYDLSKLHCIMACTQTLWDLPTTSLPSPGELSIYQKPLQPCGHVVKCIYEETSTGFQTYDTIEYKRVPIELRCDTVAIDIKMELNQRVFIEYFVPATDKH